jgi:hypothetical protein
VINEFDPQKNVADGTQQRRRRDKRLSCVHGAPVSAGFGAA